MANTIGRIPEFGIGLRIESEPVPDDEELYRLIISVRECIDGLERDGVKVFNRKNNEKDLSGKDTFRVFRKKERLTNTTHILQYLLLFLEDMPTPETVRLLPADPFVQFRDFVLDLVEDLQADDVVDAVMKDYQELGIINPSNAWVYRGKIQLFHDRLRKGLGMAVKPDREGYTSVFSALKEISLFWFGVRREDLDRIRKCDLYIFKLARVLLDKLDNNRDEAD